MIGQLQNRQNRLDVKKQDSTDSLARDIDVNSAGGGLVDRDQKQE